MTFSEGTTVGAYEIVAKLGKGGMATVYQAYHPALDRYVALKVLHAAFQDDESFLRRFTREARVVARLEHPHIVPVYDFAEHEGHPYLVMRYVEGETLKERMSQGALSKTEIARIATAVSQALDYAHQQGVLHRDIKPSNILLTSGGGVFIADFGLARIAQAGESTLSQDMIMGTPQYISPEQAKGNQELDGRTDVYSFAIVLYEMITGRVPFQSDTSYAIIHAQIFDPPPPPSELNPKISTALEAVLLQALSKEPGQRFATAGELTAAFNETLLVDPDEIAPTGVDVLPDYTPMGATNLQKTAVPPPSPTPETAVADDGESQPVPLPRRQRPLALIGLGIFLGVVLCVGLIFVAVRLRQNSNNPPATAQAVATETAVPPTATPEINPAPRPDVIRSAAELETLLAADPDNPALRVELAAAYLRQGQTDEARDLIQSTMRQIRLPIGYILAAERLLEVNETEMAAQVLEESLTKFSEDTRLQHLLIMSYALAEKPPALMRQALTRMTAGEHDPISIQIGEAYIASANGDLDGAMTILDAALADPDVDHKAEMLYFQGLLLRAMNAPQEAETAFIAAQAADPALWLAVRLEKQLNELVTESGS